MYYFLWTIFSWAELDRDDAWCHGEGFAHAHALFPVDEETVVLDGQILFQSSLGAQKFLESILRHAQFSLEVIDSLCDLANLLNQSEKEEIILIFDVSLGMYVMRIVGEKTLGQATVVCARGHDINPTDCSKTTL